MFTKTRIITFCSAFLIAVTAFSSAPAYAVSETMENLLSILRDKGSITQDEYNALMSAAKSEDEQAKKAADDQMAAVNKSLEKSSWASKVKIKGDVRLRYQYQDQDLSNERTRGRIRYRAGIIGKPMDKLEVGAGLASGGSDQRSTNQTFDNAFSTKGINLDYAYAEYQFTDSFTAIGGKFTRKKWLYQATDLEWDGDINPEGASANFTFNDGFGKGFINTGVWVIDENSGGNDDPFMVYGQIGQKFSSGNIFGTLAGTYYAFGDINAPTDISAFAGSNTDPNGDFNAFNISGELGTKVGNGKASILFDYINNVDTNTNDDTAFAIGAKYVTGDWQFKYIYADLDANAVPDFLPDSDRFDGLTGIKGHEFIAEYEVLKGIVFGLDYYATEEKATNIDQNILQADVVVKF